MTAVKKTIFGWEEIDESDVGGGVVFFMGWDRLERALGVERPALPEIKPYERIEKIKAERFGLHVYVVNKDTLLPRD